MDEFTSLIFLSFSSILDANIRQPIAIENTSYLLRDFLGYNHAISETAIKSYEGNTYSKICSVCSVLLPLQLVVALAIYHPLVLVDIQKYDETILFHYLHRALLMALGYLISLGVKYWNK